MGFPFCLLIKGRDEEDGKKIIDDGLSTVSALMSLYELWKTDSTNKPDGIPWDSLLRDTFTQGLLVKIVKYPDDGDRDVREAYNVMKHDQESLNVSFASVYSKINVCVKAFKKYGDWPKVSKFMMGACGSGSKSKTSIHRWVRAAQGLDEAVLDALKGMSWIKGQAIWDNEFLIESKIKARSKLDSEDAVVALGMMDKQDSAEVFKQCICMPMKLLRTWCSLLEKRFGSVCVQSPAYQRLRQHLNTLAGLKKVAACAKANVLLHQSGGVPECIGLFEELTKCLAGGLPPPASLVLLNADEKERLAERQRHEEEAAAIARAKANEEATMELDMLGMGPGGPKDDPSVSAGSGVAPKAVDALEENMRLVHFAESTAAVKSMSQPLVSSTARTSVVLDMVSTNSSVAADAVGTAHELWLMYQQGMGLNRTRFRILVLCGSRFDLVHKVQSKVMSVFPVNWICAFVQVRQTETQSLRSRPAYAMIVCPPEEISAEELTVLDLSHIKRKKRFAEEGIFLRCTESSCPLRCESARELIARQLGVGVEPALNMEIGKEDQCGGMLAMMAEEFGDPGEEERPEQEGTDDDGSAVEKKRDCIVELWPHAHTIADFRMMLTSMAAGDKMNVLVVMSGSAHPAPWLAALELKVPSVIATARFSEHSRAHSLALGKRLRQLALVPSVSAGAVLDLESRCIPAKVVGPQTMEAFDVSQGPLWNDGLNKMPPAAPLSKEVANLVASELDKFNLSLSHAHETRGRGLMTRTHVAEGEMVCSVSSLFYDSWTVLQSFLAMPGNEVLSDRVVVIPNVMRSTILLSKCTFVITNYIGIT